MEHLGKATLNWAADAFYCTTTAFVDTECVSFRVSWDVLAFQASQRQLDFVTADIGVDR